MSSENEKDCWDSDCNAEDDLHPDVLATWNITSERRSACTILRTYRAPRSNEQLRKEKYTDIKSLPTGDGFLHGSALWLPGSEGEEDEQNIQLSPEQPLRCFLLSHSNYKGSNFGTCSMLYSFQFITRELPADDEQLAHLGFGKCALHRKLSTLEWLKKRIYFDRWDRDLGLIRRVKGWRPGKCGNAAHDGKPPFEILDDAYTTGWLDTDDVYGIWRLHEERSDMSSFRLTFRPKRNRNHFLGHATRSEAPICCLAFCVDATLDGKAERRGEQASMTFQLYPRYRRVWAEWVEVKFKARRWALEKLLFQGLTLAEKLRARKYHV